ncbi:MAG: hypothetical protein ACE5E3_03110 [Mariprofundus sp.]
MNYVAAVLLCLGMTVLSACEMDRHERHQARHDISFTVKMHHLHMLINHALQMAAQGADMKLQGVEHASAMMDKASNLLTRAMSGPEMARLHKSGYANKPLMKMTHGLADKSVELIEQMKALSTDNPHKEAMQMLNHALEVAATGSSLIMLGQQGMAGDIDAVMVNHGQAMLGEASGLLHEVGVSDEYSALLNEVVQLLIGIPDVQHTGQSKSSG